MTPGRLRVLLFGMRCRFTLPVAEALIADPGVEVVGAVVPGNRPAMPSDNHDCRGDHVGSPSPGERATTWGRPYSAAVPVSAFDDLLRRNHIPLLEAASLRKRDLGPLLAGDVLTYLDAIVVACFPWRLPRWLREAARLGALNVHPSLLPALRGPEPEFWAIRLGLRETGVTVHLMDEGLDTGPVLLQRPVPIPAEATLPELETLLATTGGEVVREALHGLATGDLVPRPQAGVPSCAPSPNPYDLAVSTDLPAGWAARFVQAVMPVYGPVPVLVMATGQRLHVDSVLGVDEDASLPAPFVEAGEIVTVRFTPGVARFRRVPD